MVFCCSICTRTRLAIVILSFVVFCVFLTPILSDAQTTTNITKSQFNKVVILTFGDSHKSQVTNAMPILDKYGFKGNFFVTCLWVGSHIYGMPRLTWQDISALRKDGHYVSSKTMTHTAMTHLSHSDLNYEVAGSKKSLADHGINATAFATTHGNERNNATIINEIAKYYGFAVNGFGSLRNEIR